MYILQAKQMRTKKRDEVLEQKRKIGKQGSPPHIIVSIELHLFIYILMRTGGQFLYGSGMTFMCPSHDTK